jgi:hypothetical protein
LFKWRQAAAVFAFEIYGDRNSCGPSVSATLFFPRPASKSNSAGVNRQPEEIIFADSLGPPGLAYFTVPERPRGILPAISVASSRFSETYVSSPTFDVIAETLFDGSGTADRQLADQGGLQDENWRYRKGSLRPGTEQSPRADLKEAAGSAARECVRRASGFLQLALSFQ